MGMGSRMGAAAAALVALLALAAGLVYQLHGGLPDIAQLRSRSKHLSPLHAPKMLDLPELSNRSHRDDLMWGSYRPSLYFGMRTRSPKSFMSGLMWFDPDSHETLNKRKVRHHVQADDKLSACGWQRHDGRGFGRQLFVDEDYNITVSMVKHHGQDSGAAGDWAVRVAARRVRGGPSKQISLVMYLGDESSPTQGRWQVMPAGDPGDLTGTQTLATGGSSVVGPWSFHAQEHQPGGGRAARRRPAPRLDYLALPTDGEFNYFLHVKELMLGIMYEHLERNPASDSFQLYLPNGATQGSNLALFQVSGALPLTVDFVFLSHRWGTEPSLADPSDRVAALSGEPLGALLEQREAEFERRYARSFPARPAAPEAAAAAEEAGGAGAVDVELAKVALSNQLGSMGYFYGSSKVRLPDSPWAVHSTPPAALFTSVPSRSASPLGSLGEEGFHLLLLQRWDPQLAREVLAHWLDLLNGQGWLARSQVLGEEAKDHTAEEDEVQELGESGPPSLYLAVLEMARELGQASREGRGEELGVERQFLQAAWPRLAAWYAWYNSTQSGVAASTYRWRGRNSSTVLELNPRTPSSGMPDYPRASHPSPEERHLDLRCWMALASEAMLVTGEALGLPDPVLAPYRSTYQQLSDLGLLQALHQDPGSGHFLDWGLHSEEVELQRRSYPVEGQVQDITFRVVSSPPVPRLVPCFGYVSLFPLLMRLLPVGSEELGRQLKLLRDPQLLWSPFGLRSVAPTCSLYKKYNTAYDPPGWRGGIWLGVNHLALSALQHYAAQPGPWAAEAAAAGWELRLALLGAVRADHAERGYLRGQYDDGTGRGLGGPAATGWAALLALLAPGS